MPIYSTTTLGWWSVGRLVLCLIGGEKGGSLALGFGRDTLVPLLGQTIEGRRSRLANEARLSRVRRLDALDDLSSLALELGGVRFVGFLLALDDDGMQSVRKFSEYGSESVRPTSHHPMESLLTSSRLLHLWSSSNRWLLQKWPWQKPQSPEMRWAGSLHSLNSQRGFLTGMLADFAWVCMCVCVALVRVGVGKSRRLRCARELDDRGWVPLRWECAREEENKASGLGGREEEEEERKVGLAGW